MLTRAPQIKRVPIQAVKTEMGLETSGETQDRVSVCVGLSECAYVDAQIKWKDTGEAKLEPLATISLIGHRGQQGSIDGSITLSIWWPHHTGLAKRGLDAGHAHSPCLRLSYWACQSCVALTQKSIRSVMLIYAGAALPRQPYLTSSSEHF